MPLPRVVDRRPAKWLKMEKYRRKTETVQLHEAHRKSPQCKEDEISFARCARWNSLEISLRTCKCSCSGTLGAPGICRFKWYHAAHAVCFVTFVYQQTSRFSKEKKEEKKHENFKRRKAEPLILTVFFNSCFLYLYRTVHMGILAATLRILSHCGKCCILYEKNSLLGYVLSKHCKVHKRNTYIFLHIYLV